MEIEDTIEKIQAQVRGVLRLDIVRSMLISSCRRKKNQINLNHLAPLRAATKSSDDSGRKGDKVGGLSSVDEIAAVDGDWNKWRKMWIERKKVYLS
jgi:hypothetical protein